MNGRESHERRGNALLSRRAALFGCAAAGVDLALPASAAGTEEGRIEVAPAEASPRPVPARGGQRTHAIPHGGEFLPVVGLGTSRVFDVGAGQEERASCTEVVRQLVARGASIIDTAPSYGSAEAVLGGILTDTGLRSRVFLATKLEHYEPGHEQDEFRESLARLRTDKVDLLQLHNVRNAKQDLGPLRALKSRGLIRYTGITTTFKYAYDAAEAIVRREQPDFLEIDYAIDNRDAENRLLPAAAAAGTAVLVALPFGRNRLFRLVAGKPLPEWAADFDCTTWPQFFLKFVLGHPAVTAAIPGTDKPEHLIDDLGAGLGRLPDEATRARMAKYIASLS